MSGKTANNGGNKGRRKNDGARTPKNTATPLHDNDSNRRGGADSASEHGTVAGREGYATSEHGSVVTR